MCVWDIAFKFSSKLRNNNNKKNRYLFISSGIPEIYGTDQNNILHKAEWEKSSLKADCMCAGVIKTTPFVKTKQMVTSSECEFTLDEKHLLWVKG